MTYGERLIEGEARTERIEAIGLAVLYTVGLSAAIATVRSLNYSLNDMPARHYIGEVYVREVE